MSTETIQRVEEWYAVNSSRFTPRCTQLEIKSSGPEKADRGKIHIGAVASVWIGSITFWEKGDVTSMVVHKASGKTKILDDRVRNPGEGVEGLLERFFEHLLSEQ